MSGSSEEEIYKRRKKHTQIKEDLENLFEDVHEESSEPEFKYNEEHLLVEIFGTGHEYDYIYKPENTPKEESNSQKMQFTDTAPKFYYYENDIYTFLLRRSNYNETQKKSVKLLLQGYSIYYVFFHCELCFSLKVLYEIKKRINEYVKIKKTVEEGVDIGLYENLMEYTKVMQYNEKNIGEEKVFSKLFQSKYILSVNELYENVVNCEEVNICNQPNNLEEIVTEMANNENTTSHDFLTRLAKLYATHPLFIKIVINHSEHKVAEYFAGKDSSSNFRRQIIENAISNINNLSTLNDRHRQKVYKEQVKESISNTVVDMILNGSRPIKGQECVFGVLEYKNQFYCSVVDYKGKCIDYFVHKEVESIGKNCEAHKPVYVVFASLEKTLRYSIPKLKGSIDCDLIVVDNEMTFKLYGIEDLRNYAIHLAKRVMWPEIELCKIRDNRIKILHDEKYKVLTNDEYFEAFDFGIRVGLSFIGIDINKLLYADYLILLPYIGLDAYFLEQINDYGEIPSLKVLKDMGLLLQKIEKDNALLLLDPINDFDNSCVFLRCYNDILLDQFMIHPKNYGYAKVLASAAFGEGPSDDSNPIIKKVIQNPDQITKFNMSAIAQTGNSEMINIKNYLLVHKRKQFTGVTDEALFIDLVGMVKEKEYEGQIKRIDKSYFIASVFISDDDYIRKPVNGSNTVDIFVKANTSSYFSNQYINLAISDPAFSNLSYSGYVVEKKKLCKQRFIESIWYEDLSCPASQDFLLQNKKTLLVRRSSKDHKTCVVTVLISVDPKIFMHLNLVEGESNYKFNDKVYDSVDEFISRYVKKMLQQVKRIKENDHFCRNKESCKADLMFKKYVIYLSEQYLGRLVFAYNNDNKIVEEYIKIEDELVFGNKRFKDFRQFLKHRVK